MAMEAQEAKILEMMRSLDEVNERQQQQGGDLQALEGSIDTCKPCLEKSFAHIRAGVGNLQRQVEGILKARQPAGGRSPSADAKLDHIDGHGKVPTVHISIIELLGHRKDHLPGRSNAGVLATPPLPTTKVFTFSFRNFSASTEITKIQ